MLKFKTFWNLINHKEKQKFYLMILLFVILSILEVFSVAIIIPCLSIILDPEIFSSSNFSLPFTDFINSNKESVLYLFCFFLFSAFLIKNIFQLLINKFISKSVFNFKAEISKRILTKYFHQNYEYFLKNSQGKLTNYILFETNIVSERYFYSLLILLSELVIIISLLLLLILLGKFEFVLVIIPIILLGILITKLINKNIKKWSNERISIGSKNADLIQRIFLGIRDIFFSKSGQYTIEKFYNLALRQSKIDAGTAFLSHVPRAFFEIFAVLALLILLIFLKIQNYSNTQIITELAFYFAIAYRLMPSFNRIIVQYQRIKYAQTSVEHLSRILELPNQRILSLNEATEVNFESIKLENYNFSYDNKKNILTKVNFEIKRGEIVGIFGDSGSGKSTLLNLISLLLNNNTGKFYFNNKIINNLVEIKKIQEIITFVSQDTFLLDDTIKNNIIFHHDDKFDIDKFHYSIKFSKLTDLIDKIDCGEEYNIGSNSRKISSGQKQRIAIARSIYNLKQILILDEATNALDEKTEEDIIKNIHSLKSRSTIILVSHNKRNLKICDKIYSVRNNTVNLEK